jgi:eukaryotic-like serine/threonine-protein kinase
VASVDLTGHMLDDRYRVIERIGEGAMGSVYRAERVKLGRTARLPYQASRLCLERMWWGDGLKHARTAIALDPTYKTDAELIKLVVRGFNTTASYDWTLARFLRDDIGPAAKPFLEETARTHPNAIVRKRAAAELKRYP